MAITKEQLSSIATLLKEPKLSVYTEQINNCMNEFKINTPIRQAMFIAQIMHESGECVYTRELASGKAYEGRTDLGNSLPGDGVKFKGRGLIQLTGKNNYNSLSKAFGVDLISKPELLEQPELATRSAGWFWNSRSLSILADQGSLLAFKNVTKKINGGYNGLEDRVKYWNRAKQIFGIK